MALAPFSTLTELKEHWPAMNPDLDSEASSKLEEASVEVRALYPDLDTRIDAGALDAAVPRLVVNRMVKRALTPPLQEFTGVSSATAQTGPFAHTLNFTNPDANMYLTKADRRLLESGRPGRQAFTIHPGGTQGPFLVLDAESRALIRSELDDA